MILGVVCEYNPFHLGHAYHLQKSREAAGENAVVVCVMSGDFVQRGEAAVYSKFARGEAACRCGADLVVELPLPWCLSSAEGFARGAVGLLGALGAERLCFGSESAETEALKEVAEMLLEPDFLPAVKARLAGDGTLSFAAARQREAEARLGNRGKLLSRPNDILAVEYLKAIQSLRLDMEAFAVARWGSGHDQTGGEGPRSASELRHLLSRGESVEREIPAEAAAVYQRERERGRELRSPNALELALLSRLRMLEEEDFLKLPDAADGLGQRLYRAVREGCSVEEILTTAKTRRYALARLRRMLLCACLGVEARMSEGTPPYARVLAANARGRALLRARAGDGAVPIVTKAASVRELSDNCGALFTLGAAAHDVYVLGYTAQEERRPGGDWRTSPSML